MDGAVHCDSRAPFLMASKRMLEVVLRHEFHSTPVLSLSRAINSVVVPINDINNTLVHQYSESEQLIRCKLASLYRLIDLYKCSQGIYNHITVSICICVGTPVIRLYKMEGYRVQDCHDIYPR